MRCPGSPGRANYLSFFELFRLGLLLGAFWVSWGPRGGKDDLQNHSRSGLRAPKRRLRRPPKSPYELLKTLTIDPWLKENHTGSILKPCQPASQLVLRGPSDSRIVSFLVGPTDVVLIPLALWPSSLWAQAPNSRCSDTLQEKLSSSASTSDYPLKTAELHNSWCAIEKTHLKLNKPWIVSNHNSKQGFHARTPKDLGEMNLSKCKFKIIGCVPGHTASNWPLKPTSLWLRSGSVEANAARDIIEEPDLLLRDWGNIFKNSGR